MGASTKKPAGMAGMGCLVLFSLPFAGVGVGMTVWALLSLVQWSDAQDWVEVPAVIEEADLHTSTSDDGTTYQATATYRYTYEGRVYTGTRVALDGLSDNIGDFQQRAARTLERHEQSGEPFRCYVNPENPSKAVLFRDFRPLFFGFKLMFGLVFGGAGFGMLIGGIYGARKQREVQALEATHPDAPWQWKPDWQSGVIKSSNKAAMIGGLIFAGFWNAICFPIVFVLPWNEVTEEPVMLVVLIFPLVGVGAAVFAIRKVMQWFKYGETTFQMASVPGVIGGNLDGLIRIPAYIRPREGFDVALRNVHTRTSGSGKNRRTSTNTLWSAELTVPPEEVLIEAEQSAIPIHFTIPSDKRETDESNPNSKYTWKLEVKAEVPGVDYDASFEVPVFRTAESQEVSAEEAVVAHTRSELDPQEQMAAAGVDVMQIAQGMQFVFRAGRLWGTGLTMLIFGAIFVAAGIGVGLSGAPIIFPIVFPLVGGVIMLIGLNLLFGKMVITIDGAGLTRRSTILGVGTSKRVDRHNVDELSHRVGMTVNEKPYYDVYLEQKEGGKIRIGRTFASESQAVAYKGVVLAALGL